MNASLSLLLPTLNGGEHPPRQRNWSRSMRWQRTLPSLCVRISQPAYARAVIDMVPDFQQVSILPAGTKPAILMVIDQEKDNYGGRDRSQSRVRKADSAERAHA